MIARSRGFRMLSNRARLQEQRFGRVLAIHRAKELQREAAYNATRKKGVGLPDLKTGVVKWSWWRKLIMRIRQLPTYAKKVFNSLKIK